MNDDSCHSADSIAAQPSKKSILEMNHVEARKFFLKSESYCSLDFPPYIKFDKIIDNVHRLLDGRCLSSMYSSSHPKDHDDVNYTILNNKDGKYAWRPFQLIHPALYVSLVHCLTEDVAWKSVLDRFEEFSANPNISCLSLPVASLTNEKDKAAQVTHWWHAVEQYSIELSLDYQFLLETDITDCYGAIYTHSIAWALHTKPKAKEKEQRKKKTLGNQIDWHIQNMRHGQTNGIPQGSVLMDFIAEMVLGLADLDLSEKIEAAGITDYRILRYRDDYKIFVNNSQDGERIIKFLTEVTIGLGLKLNPGKTKASREVVRASIKADKLAWISRKYSERNLQKNLFIIHDHAHLFPNAGSLVVALGNFYKRLSRQKQLNQVMPLIAITVDIAYCNPRTYSICAAILSKLMSFLETTDEKRNVAEKIRARFEKIPNTGHIQVWVQRITYPLAQDISYEETICKLVAGEAINLWNCDWISNREMSVAISSASIIDREILDNMKPIVPASEVELFVSKSLDGYYG